MISPRNNNINNDNSGRKNMTRYNGLLLMEVMNNKNQMSIDVKNLLNKKIIKNIAFNHIMHGLKEPKNDLLASDGPLCYKFVMIDTNNNVIFQVVIPFVIINAKIYFQAV